ncbi:MAG: helix-hairpin-helix domain-containing protein [Planctomycetota bacterium]
MTQLRPRARAAELRCPWCFAGAEGERWVTCPRDETPIHAGCLAEFQCCPICRQPVEAALPTRAAPPAAREGPIRVVVERRELTLEPLPLPVYRLLAQIRHEHRRIGFLGGLGWVVATTLVSAAVATLSASAATVLAALSLLALAVVAASPPAPSVARLTRGEAGLRGEQLAERLVARDRDALSAARQHGHHLRDGARVTRELAALDDARRWAYRAHLQASTPIEDAQRIKGIGPGTTSALRAAGFTDLTRLRGQDVTEVPGIGPRRAELLAAWASERRDAIERLIAALGAPGSEEGFPGRAEVDARFAPQRDALVAQGRAAQEEGARLRAQLEAWAEERPHAREELARELARLR